MSVMESSDRNLKLYEEATEKLCAGDFDEALKLYALSMHDEDVYGSMKGYNAMGITFYLKGDVSMAIKCYAVCSRFAALSIPEILQDYQAMLKGDTEAKDRLLARCSYLAADWGWSESKAQMDEKSQSLNGNNEQLYRDLLMGKREEDSLSNGEKLSYSQYLLECRKIGYDLIFLDFQNMIDDRDGTTEEMKQWIADIFDVVKKLVMAADKAE